MSDADILAVTLALSAVASIAAYLWARAELTHKQQESQTLQCEALKRAAVKSSSLDVVA